MQFNRETLISEAHKHEIDPGMISTPSSMLLVGVGIIAVTLAFSAGPILMHGIAKLLGVSIFLESGSEFLMGCAIYGSFFGYLFVCGVLARFMNFSIGKYLRLFSGEAYRLLERNRGDPFLHNYEDVYKESLGLSDDKYMAEHGKEKQFFEWCRKPSGRYPDYQYFYAGARVLQGVLDKS